MMIMRRALLGWTRLVLAAAVMALLLGAGAASERPSVASAQAGTLQVSAGGPYSGQVGQSILFTAQAFGAVAGSPVTFLWSFGDGGSATGQSVTHVYTTAGTFPVTVFAQSTANQTGSASTSAQVGGSQTGTIQVFAGGPYSGAVGVPILFTAQATLNGVALNTQAQFRWTFTDGTTAFGQSVSKSFLTAGVFTATVSVTANTGQTGTGSATVQIGGAQTGALQVNAGGPYFGQVGAPVTLTAQALLNGVPISAQAQYLWNFGDGATGFGQTTAKTYAAGGFYTVSVTATLPNGQSGTGTATVQIGGAQTGALQISAGGPYTAAVGQTVTLSATVANLPAGATVNYVWTFGDGTTAAGQTVSKVFNTPGTVTATVSVTSSSGLTGTATTSVNVGGSSPTTPSGATEQITLFAACNNVAVTWPNGTPLSVVAAAISPSNALIAIWRFDNIRQTFVGYSTLPGAPNDLTTVNRAEPVFICMNGSGTLTRPVI